MGKGFKQGRLNGITKLKRCFYIKNKKLAYNGVKFT